MINRMLLLIIPAFVLATGLLAGKAHAAEAAGPTNAEIATTPSQFLRLEITSNCSSKGAVFKIVNRGAKWPRRGTLRLFHADNKSQMTERKLRLASNQKVSFVIKKELLDGRPIGLWIEPEWYERGFEYDARVSCK